MDRTEPSCARDSIYSDDLQPDAVALAIELFAGACPEPALNYVARVAIDGFPYTLYYMNGEMTTRRGADAPAVATISADVATYMQAFRKELSISDAKARMTLSGDQKVIGHLLRCIAHKDAYEDELAAAEQPSQYSS